MKQHLEDPGIMTRQQQQVLMVLGPIGIIVAVIGTFYVAQYRLGSVERNLSMLSDSNIQLVKDVAVIKDRLGIRANAVPSDESNAPRFSEMEPAPVSQSVTVSSAQEKREPTATPSPQLQPTPLPVPTPIIPVPTGVLPIPLLPGIIGQ